MKQFSLPECWHGIILPQRWQKPYGMCLRQEKMIEVYPPVWIPGWRGIRDYFTMIAWNHEALHAWGNPGCDNVWCPGYEGATWKELLAMPLQFIEGFRFCDLCMSHYEGE